MTFFGSFLRSRGILAFLWRNTERSIKNSLWISLIITWWVCGNFAAETQILFFFWVFLTANIFCIPVLCGPKVSLSLWRIGRTRPFVAAFYMAGQQSLPDSALAAGETYVWWLADSTNLEPQILVCCWWKKLRFVFGRGSGFRPVSCHDPMRGVELSWESCGGKFGGSFEVDSSTGMLIGEKIGGDGCHQCMSFCFGRGGSSFFRKKHSHFGRFWGGYGWENLDVGFYALFLRNGSAVIMAAKRQRIRKGRSSHCDPISQ